MRIKSIEYARGYSPRDHLLDDSDLLTLRGAEFTTMNQLRKAVRAVATGTGEPADGLPIRFVIPTPKGDLERLMWF